MRWHEEREAFKKRIVQYTIQDLRELSGVPQMGYQAPGKLVQRWMDKFYHTPTEFTSPRRYVNRFKLGADPEFIFVHERDDCRIDAQTLGFKQGLAYGADNNGRLTEIRPYPSRSALEVMASILETLRWMYVKNRDIRNLRWQSGAFLFQDGLGGHVHFGRKRPTRKQEIAALDYVEATLAEVGAFPNYERELRRRGDAHRQLYGHAGDFRLQQHGYEYRTFASWMDSPALAFVVVTLSKLAVQDPYLITESVHPLDIRKRISQVENFLRYYKDVDDDARLAVALLKRTWVAHNGGDFKVRWGFPPVPVPDLVTYPVHCIPTSIKPSKETIDEMFNHLLKGEPLTWRHPVPTWEPTHLPKGYRMLIDESKTIGIKGMGEIIWDLCCSGKQFPVQIVDNRGEHYFSVEKGFRSMLTGNWRESYTIGSIGAAEYSIGLSAKSRSLDKMKDTRRWLLAHFPIWKASEVKQDSIDKWVAAHPNVGKKDSKHEKLLYGSSRIPI